MDSDNQTIGKYLQTKRPGDLSFKVGDQISILKKGEGGWWEGQLNGTTGQFPCNYVQEITTTRNRSISLSAPARPQPVIKQSARSPKSSPIPKPAQNFSVGEKLKSLAKVSSPPAPIKNPHQELEDKENRKLSERIQQLERELDNRNGTNLEGLSISQLKQLIKIQKEGTTKLKLKLEYLEQTQDELSKCVVCFSNPKDMIVVPCGHKILCQECVKKTKWTSCPVCKTAVSSIVRVFE